MKDFATFIKPTEVPKKSLKRKFKLFFFSFNTRSGWEVKKDAFWSKTYTRGVCRRPETLLKKEIGLITTSILSYSAFTRK